MKARYIIEISRDGMGWMLAAEMFKWLPRHFGDNMQKAEEALAFAKGKKLVLANGQIQTRIRDENDGGKEEVPAPKKKPRKRRKKEVTY